MKKAILPLLLMAAPFFSSAQYSLKPSPLSVVPDLRISPLDKEIHALPVATRVLLWNGVGHAGAATVLGITAAAGQKHFDQPTMFALTTSALTGIILGGLQMAAADIILSSKRKPLRPKKAKKGVDAFVE